MWTSSKAKNDCVLTAISNLTGIDYDKVLEARAQVNGISTGKHAGATLTSKIPDMLKILGYRSVICNELPSTTPCLFRFSSGPKSKCGHMVACIDGIAIESDGKHWPVKSRRLWNRMCIYIYPLNQ